MQQQSPLLTARKLFHTHSLVLKQLGLMGNTRPIVWSGEAEQHLHVHAAIPPLRPMSCAKEARAMLQARTAAPKVSARRSHPARFWHMPLALTPLKKANITHGPDALEITITAL